MLGSCRLFTHLQLHEMLSAELPRSRLSCAQSQEVRFSFEKLRFRRIFW
jgi:hypothetical protein